MRSIRIEGPIAVVPLTRGYEAIIDACDVPLVEGRLWSALVSKRRKAVYAVRTERGRMILMHRIISEAPDGTLCDHEDGDGLNNRRKNIRHCSQAQNNRNTGRRKDNTSGRKGVSFDKKAGRWRAEITSAGKRKFLGYFGTTGEAHAAYQAASLALHGEFARAS